MPISTVDLALFHTHAHNFNAAQIIDICSKMLDGDVDTIQAKALIAQQHQLQAVHAVATASKDMDDRLTQIEQWAASITGELSELSARVDRCVTDGEVSVRLDKLELDFKTKLNTGLTQVLRGDDDVGDTHALVCNESIEDMPWMLFASPVKHPDTWPVSPASSLSSVSPVPVVAMPVKAKARKALKLAQPAQP